MDAFLCLMLVFLPITQASRVLPNAVWRNCSSPNTSSKEFKKCHYSKYVIFGNSWFIGADFGKDSNTDRSAMRLRSRMSNTKKEKMYKYLKKITDFYTPTKSYSASFTTINSIQDGAAMMNINNISSELIFLQLRAWGKAYFKINTRDAKHRRMYYLFSDESFALRCRALISVSKYPSTALPFDGAFPHLPTKPVYKRSAIATQHESRQNIIFFRENCPRICLCAVEAGRKITIKVNCANKHLDQAPSDIPFGTTTVDLHRNNLNSLANIDAYWWKTVTHLDITENAFTHLEYSEIPPEVTTLDLGYNYLTDVSTVLREKITKRPNYKVFLAGNSWNCSCEHINLIQWIKTNSDKVGDYRNVLCYWSGNLTSKIKNIPLQLYCTRKIFPVAYTIKYIVTMILLSVPVLLALAVLYNHRLTIVSVLHHYKLYPSCFDKQSPDDAIKLYDLFACYHVRDRETANIALSILGPSYRVCVQEHGWMPKINAERDLLFRFFSSKRALVFVSRRFGKSAWFQTQFRRLYNTELRFHLNRLIIIIIKEPGRDYYLEAMIQTFYSTEHLLIWGERWFWQKLRFLLRNTAKKVVEV